MSPNPHFTSAQQQPYALFMRWLILAGLIAFAGYLTWDLGLLQPLLFADRTRIGLLITLIFTLGSLHCAMRSWWLSRQQQALQQLVCDVDTWTRESALRRPTLPADTSTWRIPPFIVQATQQQPASLASDYFIAITGRLHGSGELALEPDKALLLQVMAEQARGQHEAGWFAASALIKLGLLGTVVGFLLMLAPVTSLESFDQTQIQHLLKQMTVGMGVALSTTLLGLVATLLLGVQYLMLDRAADRLMAQTVQLTEAYLCVNGAERI